MLKIDSHTHILPRVMPKWSEKFGYGGFIHLEVSRPGFANMMRDDAFFREIASNCWDAEERIEEYGKAGVQVQVVSTIPVMFSYWAKPLDAADLARFLNEPGRSSRRRKRLVVSGRSRGGAQPGQQEQAVELYSPHRRPDSHLLEFAAHFSQLVV